MSVWTYACKNDVENDVIYAMKSTKNLKALGRKSAWRKPEEMENKALFVSPVPFINKIFNEALCLGYYLRFVGNVCRCKYWKKVRIQDLWHLVSAVVGWLTYLRNLVQNNRKPESQNVVSIAQNLKQRQTEAKN